MYSVIKTYARMVGCNGSVQTKSKFISCMTMVHTLLISGDGGVCNPSCFGAVCGTGVLVVGAGDTACSVCAETVLGRRSCLPVCFDELAAV